MKFRAGNEQYIAGPGDCIYLPTGLQHEFKLETETTKCTILIEPGGFEDFFIDFSVPAEALTLPQSPTGLPSPELIKRFVDSLAKWGVDMPLMANV